MAKKILALLLIFFMTLGASLPVLAAGEVSVQSPSALLMDAETGTVLFEKNPDEKRAIASITKLMTMLLVLEKLESGEAALSDVVTCSDKARTTGGTTMFLDRNETITIEGLLHGLIIASANDAAVALAEHLFGSEEGCVARMNEKAAEMEMTGTHFVNVHGLPGEGGVSTARDVAILSREALRHSDFILPLTSTVWEDYTHTDGRETMLSNTNRNILTTISGADGLKTGYTDAAGYCVSATAKRNDLRLIAVVLGASTKKARLQDADRMLDYGFGNFELKTIVQENEVILWDVPVRKGREKTVNLLASESFSILTPIGQEPMAEKQVYVEENLKAPIGAGDPLGRLEIIKDGETIASIPLVAERAIEKTSFSDALYTILTTYFKTTHAPENPGLF